MSAAARLLRAGLAGLAALLVVGAGLGLTAPAPAQDQSPGQSLAPAPAPPAGAVVLRQETSLRGPQGQPLETAAALTILAGLACRQGADPAYQIVSPGGQKAWLPQAQGLWLDETPAQARRRLERLRAVDLDRANTLRILSGRIAVGDTPWLVETAWGPPQRRFMVNYFVDEEHLVYLPPGSPPLLLRFKGGRLSAPLAAASLPAAVETPCPPR